jgi:hypothetical protein
MCAISAPVPDFMTRLFNLWQKSFVVLRIILVTGGDINWDIN